MSRLPTLAPRMAGNVPPAVERPCCKEHTEDEWEAIKHIVQQLYIGDNRKLIETMAIIETKHGFAATEQMYKKRLKKWNIRKRAYRKSSESSAASTVVSTPAPTSDVGDCEDSEAEAVSIQHPSGESSLSLIHLSQPEAYAGLELVLDSVYSWSSCKIYSPPITTDPMSRYLANTNQPPMRDSRTMYRTFELVFDLWCYGKGQLAGMAARKAFYALEFVLEEDHPDLIWHVLDAIYDMVDRGHLQLLFTFLKYTRVLGPRYLPPNHPLLRIIQQLWNCDYQTDQGRQFVCYLLRQAWLRNVDILSHQIGSVAPQHLWLYEQLIWDGRTRLRKDSDLARRQHILKAALTELSKQQELCAGDDSESDQLRIEALMLEFTQMDLGDQEEAEKLARELLDHTESETGARSNARFHAYARKMLARLYEQKQDWNSAEENLRCAITKRETAHGTNTNLRVIRDMWVLAAHYQRAGRQESADRVAQDAIARAEQYLTDIPG